VHCAKGAREKIRVVSWWRVDTPPELSYTWPKWYLQNLGLAPLLSGKGNPRVTRHIRQLLLVYLNEKIHHLAHYLALRLVLHRIHIHHQFRYHAPPVQLYLQG